MNDYNFGNFICMLRERKGLTQQDVADILGVTPAAVSKWENGSSKPRVEMLCRLAKLLGVRIEELLAGQFLPEESISPEAVQRINERYEYLSKIESYASTRVKLKRLASAFIDLFSAGMLVFLAMFLAQKINSLVGGDDGTEAASCVLSGLLVFFVVFGLHDIIGFGRSLGKRIMGLIILDKQTGENASKKQIFSRNITTFGTTMVYSKHMGFKSEGWILFVEYDTTVYAEKKTGILNNTTFLEEPVVVANYYRLPVTAFSYKKYQMKIVPDARYRPYSCDSFGLIGFDDANNCIVYCYHYSYDYNHIAENGDDLEAEMCAFMDDVFVWKDDIVSSAE